MTPAQIDPLFALFIRTFLLLGAWCLSKQYSNKITGGSNKPRIIRRGGFDPGLLKVSQCRYCHHGPCQTPRLQFPRVTIACDVITLRSQIHNKPRCCQSGKFKFIVFRSWEGYPGYRTFDAGCRGDDGPPLPPSRAHRQHVSSVRRPRVSGPRM